MSTLGPIWPNRSITAGRAHVGGAHAPDGADAGTGQKRDGGFGHVGQVGGHPVAGLHAHVLQRHGQRRDLALQFGPRQHAHPAALVFAHDGGLPRRMGRPGVAQHLARVVHLGAGKPVHIGHGAAFQHGPVRGGRLHLKVVPHALPEAVQVGGGPAPQRVVVCQTPGRVRGPASAGTGGSVRMPEMDGAAFLEQVRLHHPDTVRLLLTGYSDITSTIAAINRGEIHRYIAKPWDDQDLLLIVREALAKRELEAENARLLALTRQQNAELQDLNQGLERRVAARTAELEQINNMLEAAYEETEANFNLAITVFSGMLEMRRGQMAGHARRVSDIAGRMAMHLGMNARQRQDVVLAALLHDIGQLGFPDEMLAKPVSQYSQPEMQRYRRHPLEGEAALMAMDKLLGASLIIRQHHERLDGRGFPDMLAGEAISLGARIVSVASDFDGMESGHLSDHALQSEHALSVVREGIGTRYDEAVVTALEKALREIAREACADIEVDVRMLKPGMVLTRDLQTPKGATLLPNGFRFDEAMLKRVQDLAERFDTRITVHVQLGSIEVGLRSRLLAAVAGGRPPV
jgi:response regulator RpfG family c-di-GMP phosphodiesterase